MIQGPNNLITNSLRRISLKQVPQLKHGDSLQRLIGIDDTNPQPQQVTLWSILSLKAWQELNEKGVLRCRKHHVWGDHLKDWSQQYDWIRSELQQRIGPSNVANTYPIWAWYQRYSAEKAMPDLRHSEYRSIDTPSVRVEISVKNTRVLLSDFILWNFALNNWQIPKSTADSENWEKLLEKIGHANKHKSGDLPEKFKRALKKSWRRIFQEIILPDHLPDTKSHLDKSIQACLWEIRIEDVRRFTVFATQKN
ncbi:MAG: DUF3841 domain-containing protein [Bdellovibrionota bacterium]